MEPASETSFLSTLKSSEAIPQLSSLLSRSPVLESPNYLVSIDLNDPVTAKTKALASAHVIELYLKS